MTEHISNPPMGPVERLLRMTAAHHLEKHDSEAWRAQDDTLVDPRTSPIIRVLTSAPIPEAFGPEHNAAPSFAYIIEYRGSDAHKGAVAVGQARTLGATSLALEQLFEPDIVADPRREAVTEYARLIGALSAAAWRRQSSAVYAHRTLSEMGIPLIEDGRPVRPLARLEQAVHTAFSLSPEKMAVYWSGADTSRGREILVAPVSSLPETPKSLRNFATISLERMMNNQGQYDITVALEAPPEANTQLSFRFRGNLFLPTTDKPLGFEPNQKLIDEFASWLPGLQWSVALAQHEADRRPQQPTVQ